MLPQYVYCMSNPSLGKDIYKIGKSRNPKIRQKELSNTSLPTPFSIEFIIETDDASQLEKDIHNYINDFRVNKNREFFKIEIETLKDIIEINIQ